MSHVTGEAVSLEFNSADASAAAAMTIKDANQATRTLAATERLIVDRLFATVAGTISVDVVADADADGNVDAGERIAAFTATAFEFGAGEEGYSLPVGLTPKVKASGAGAVTINGSGRIVRGSSTNPRPNWRENRQ